MSVIIKAGSYCPICKGVVLSDCKHEAREFGVRKSRGEGKSAAPSRCPTCDSNQPHLHPAVQFEGEVEVCADAFHLTPTPQNKPEYIAAVLAKRTVYGSAAWDQLGASDATRH